jgi:hypothetical protein
VFVAQTNGILPAETMIFVSTLIAIAYLIWQWRRFGEAESRVPG